ncbi:MAG TPA: class I SAM-dependent methyltransferase [Verrucomicrobiae bacterium]|nr:class I SAM-dependent methyltransferase [Verrucomicrobiae bacterium]
MKSVTDSDPTNVEAAPAPWALEATQRSIAFSQVREDATLDQWVVDRLPVGAEILMVASGGCTAAALAAMPKVARLHLIDPNAAQIALSRLKLLLLTTAEATQRISILGHAPMSTLARRSHLITAFQALDLPDDALGPLDLMAKVGPDHAGRYEVLFSKLRETLGDAEHEITALLQLRDPAEQSRRADPATHLGRTLDGAFDAVMTLPNLVQLFGEAATRNRCEPFSRHFARRTRHALASLPAAENPYLWQMLLGRFPKDILYPWLSLVSPDRMPEVMWTVTTMADAMQGFSEAFDFIHLSNILDWVTPDEARATLDLTWRALRPNGLTLIRQLNSSLDIQTLGGRFEWQLGPAGALQDRDRSFFYRRLHLGKRG